MPAATSADVTCQCTGGARLPYAERCEEVFAVAQHVQPSHTALPATPAVEAHSGNRLGPFLCWAVVFADIGTSIY